MEIGLTNFNNRQKMDAEEREKKEKKMAKALVATQRRMARLV